MRVKLVVLADVTDSRILVSENGTNSVHLFTSQWSLYVSPV